jgi:hypothetical protein
MLQVGETCLNELTINDGCEESDGLLMEPVWPDELPELLLMPVTLMVWPT